jgi:hypothetical protein
VSATILFHIMFTHKLRLHRPLQPSIPSTATTSTSQTIIPPSLESASVPSWLQAAILELKAIKGPSSWADLVDTLWLLDVCLGYPSGKVCSLTALYVRLLTLTVRVKHILLVVKVVHQRSPSGSNTHVLTQARQRSTIFVPGERRG